jgi:hypothetical protein
VFNPLNTPVEKTLHVPLYYTGLDRSALVRREGVEADTLTLDRDHSIDIAVSVPAGGMTWYVIEEPADELPRAFIDGLGPGWRALEETDFAPVNGYEDTWQWRDSVLYSTGEPVGVMRTRDAFKNFEMVIQWRHLRSAGNSGVFAWVPLEALENLPPGDLPDYGIEIQMLDHGYKTAYEARTGEAGDWFSTNGDIFPVGNSTLTPFPPTSPNGARSFPSKNLSKGVGEWNHYYVRAINGEVRLWVNGEEVSGGTGAVPAKGHLCLEAEGSPIEFKNFRIRELP